MQATIEKTPPIEPSYTLTLTLTKDELSRLKNVFGGIIGGGPTRNLTDSIYGVIDDVLKTTVSNLDTQVDTYMHLTGK